MASASFGLKSAKLLCTFMWKIPIEAGVTSSSPDHQHIWKATPSMERADEAPCLPPANEIERVCLLHDSPHGKSLKNVLPKAAPCSAGPRSSAVVGGYTFLHEELERRLARLKQTEECLLFPTGFAANMAVVSALCSSPDVTIFSDELNHASIVDGARLATRQQVLLHGHIATRILHKSLLHIYAAAAV